MGRTGHFHVGATIRASEYARYDNFAARRSASAASPSSICRSARAKTRFAAASGAIAGKPVPRSRRTVTAAKSKSSILRCSAGGGGAYAADRPCRAVGGERPALPMHTRNAATAASERTTAITRIFDPHRSQRRASTVNTRRNRSLHAHRPRYAAVLVVVPARDGVRTRRGSFQSLPRPRPSSGSWRGRSRPGGSRHSPSPMRRR